MVPHRVVETVIAWQKQNHVSVFLVLMRFEQRSIILESVLSFYDLIAKVQHNKKTQIPWEKWLKIGRDDRKKKTKCPIVYCKLRFSKGLVINRTLVYLTFNISFSDRKMTMEFDHKNIGYGYAIKNSSRTN